MSEEIFWQSCYGHYCNITLEIDLLHKIRIKIEETAYPYYFFTGKTFQDSNNKENHTFIWDSRFVLWQLKILGFVVIYLLFNI
jgi:hypothetical protein